MEGDEFNNMMNKELNEHFEKMVSTHAEDVEKKVGGVMEKIADLEGTFNTKFDNINTTLTDLTGKFDRLLEGFKQPRIPSLVLPSSEQPRARRVLREDPWAQRRPLLLMLSWTAWRRRATVMRRMEVFMHNLVVVPVHILTTNANTLRYATMNM